MAYQYEVGNAELQAVTPSSSFSLAAGLTTLATVSSHQGVINGFTFLNLNSTPAYVQFFDTQASVTLGLTTPTMVIPLPANATAANGSGTNMTFDNGININAGIKIAGTTAATGNTAVTTGILGTVWYR